MCFLFLQCSRRYWWRCQCTVTNAEPRPWRLQQLHTVCIHRYEQINQNFLQLFHHQLCQLISINGMIIYKAGVSKVSIEGADKDHIEVIGDGVDSVCLTRLLRKKLRSATIVKVEEVKEAKADTKEEKPTPPVQCISSASYCAPQCPSMYYGVVCEYPEPNNCSIM